MTCVREINQCSLCLFWQRVSREQGECRFRAPEPGGWPDTNPDDWCGDFRSSLTPPAEPLPQIETR